MRAPRPVGLVLLSLCLAACASTDTPRWEPREPEGVSWEEGCQDTRTLELLCSEDTCAFFRCQDLTEASEEPSGEVEPARWPGLRPPDGLRRWWRHPRRGAEPVFVIRWHNHPAPSLNSRRGISLDLLIKHHLFPQAPDLAAWFHRQGINIHQYTLLISRGVHLRIHSGGPRGGRWNEEWRQFTRGRERVTHEEIWQHAIKLIIKYDLTGASMLPYR
ncbi:TIGR02269 family lipoprotein [Hyalangium sp.]|uniref:SitA6 family polymorphic toxin lipoprotein n=1 Tax=Hyalangium sp. TaxID=2028555 RepID=UPI0039C8B661